MAFHPLNKEKYSNTLTNALNATLITDNGNYGTLQQELGNAKVESAYLPCGYVPLGCREFGGVMYVVSYNPFTGKSQIGSFPSPERNITSNEVDSLGHSIDYSHFFDPDRKAENRENPLFNTFEKIYPIGEDITLKPGDEFLNFIIYGSSSHEKDGSLLDYDMPDILSTTGSPRLISVKLYAKNSNGNMTDITDSIRKVHSTFDDVDISQFPFYICSDANEPDIDEFIAGYDRNSTPYVVWNQNYSGELVANIEIESVEDFNVAIDTSIDDSDDDKKIAMTFSFCVDDEHDAWWRTGVYEYNGKIYVTEEAARADGGDDSTITHHTGGVHIVLNQRNGSETAHTLDEYVSADNYTIELTINDYEDGDGLLDYSLTPYIYCGDVTSLERTGTIDLTKVNSGLYEVTKWKYYNGNEDGVWTTTISAHTDYYPKEGTSIENASLRIWNILDYDIDSVADNYITINDVEGFTKMGDFTLTFTSSDGIIADQVYLVEVILDEYCNGEKLSARNLKDRLFVFNTSVMYNDHYKGNVMDFNTLDPIATADLSVSLVNQSHSSDINRLCDDNVYNGTSPFSETELERGNTIYSRYSTKDKAVTGTKATYNLFSVDENTAYVPKLVFSYDGCDVSGGTLVMQDGTRNEYYDEFSNHITGLVKSVQDDHRNAWQWMEYDAATGILSREANVFATVYAEQTTTKLDYDRVMTCMMSDEMADRYWKTLHTGSDGKKTMLLDNIIGENPERKNKYVEPNILFYINRGLYLDNRELHRGRKTYFLYSGDDSQTTFGEGVMTDGYYSYWKYISDTTSTCHRLNNFNYSNMSEVDYGDSIKTGSSTQFNLYGGVNFLGEGGCDIYSNIKSSAPGAILVANMSCPYAASVTYGSVDYGIGNNVITAGYFLVDNNHARQRDLYHNYRFFIGKAPIITGLDGTSNLEPSDTVQPLSYMNKALRKKSNIFSGMYQGTEGVFQGCSFQFKSNSSDSFSDAQYLMDCNIFPVGVSHDEIEVTTDYNQIPILTSDGWVRIHVTDISHRHIDFENMLTESYVYKYERDITHEGDFGSPVYDLFEQVYIPTKISPSRVIDQFFILENYNYYSYKTLTFKTGYSISGDDGGFAGSIHWDNGYLDTDLKPAVKAITSWDDSEYAEWGNSNLAIADTDISNTNGNLSVPDDSVIKQVCYSPDANTIVKKISYTDTDIVYIRDDGSYSTADYDGDVFVESGIYHIVDGELKDFDDGTVLKSEYTVHVKSRIRGLRYQTQQKANEEAVFVEREALEDLEYEYDQACAVYFVASRWKVKDGELLVNRSAINEYCKMYPMALSCYGEYKGTLAMRQEDKKDGDLRDIDKNWIGVAGFVPHFPDSSTKYPDSEDAPDIDSDNRHYYGYQSALAKFFIGEDWENAHKTMYNILGPEE